MCIRDRPCSRRGRLTGTGVGRVPTVVAQHHRRSEPTNYPLAPLAVPLHATPRPTGCDSGPMDTDVSNNRLAWESASEKYVREYDDLLRQAADHSSLLERELDLLRPLLAPAPAVVHLMSCLLYTSDA